MSKPHEERLGEAIQRAQEEIARACARSHRAIDRVRLLAAVKNVAPERIREAYALGLRLFGENRVQERALKRAALEDLEGAEWHLLGPLQSNKAGAALDLFDCLETVDSLELARRLDRLAGERERAKVPVLIEVNIAAEAQKHGIAPDQAPELAAALASLAHLELRGLMAVPPAATDPEASRRHFAALASLAGGLGVAELSMGMSTDYTVAIEEGATIVRLGSALFGARPAPVVS
ncbi:MAG TPA: YggS family pyridoxal phosphate-dependent enzyme [Terriglobales bacterium]|nr:YggS family pyridoxal phosphate-dependent enzyme [Terriglobales bacterium]